MSARYDQFVVIFFLRFEYSEIETFWYLLTQLISEMSNKRITMKPIRILASELEEREKEIQSFLSIDISECSNNLDELQQTIKKLEDCYGVYADLSRQAVLRLTQGSITKALEFRRRRITLHSEITEMVKLSNLMRVGSNLEKESELAILSITSQRPTNVSIPLGEGLEQEKDPLVVSPTSSKFEDGLYSLPRSDLIPKLNNS